jgi:hypothetical protein
MIAPLLVVAIAIPFLLALWVAAWLVCDLFAGPATVPVEVRTHRIRR